MRISLNKSGASSDLEECAGDDQPSYAGRLLLDHTRFGTLFSTCTFDQCERAFSLDVRRVCVCVSRFLSSVCC